MQKKNIVVVILIAVIVLFAATWLACTIYQKHIDSGEAAHSAQGGTQAAGALYPDSAPLSIDEQLQESNKEVIEIELAPITVAIYGSDVRTTETSRSDVIMVLKYDPEDNSITMVSIPRDSRVEIPGRGLDKINHAYAYGGAELLTQTIEDLFEITIDYYFIFTFEDFSEIIDKLGGVDVDAEKDFTYDDGVVCIPKGQQKLDGAKALFYVRFRSDSEGDYGRIRRQQEVISSLYQTLFDGESNWERSFMDIYAQNLETNIDLTKLLEYDQLLNAPEKVAFHKYMLENSGKIIDKIWYGIIGDESLAEIKEILGQ
jgi:LCP family protein required for cell wall assembly